MAVTIEIAKERERCAFLAEALASRWEAGALRIRKDGEYSFRALWPPFKKITMVKPNWEKSAEALEDAASGLRTVAKGIRRGWNDPAWEPDLSKYEIEEKING